MIIPSLTFNCYGRIKHASYLIINASQPVNDLPKIQLWRPSSSGSNVYSIIGETQFLYGYPIEHTQFYFIDAIFNIPQIKFQPGDVIGYYQPPNPRHLLWSINEAGYVSYSINASTAATKINTSNIDYTDDGVVPFVRVGLGEYDLMSNNILAIICVVN